MMHHCKFLFVEINFDLFKFLKEMAEVLAKYWENVEKTYVGNSKHVFRKLRDERENIYRYFYQIK